MINRGRRASGEAKPPRIQVSKAHIPGLSSYQQLLRRDSGRPARSSCSSSNWSVRMRRAAPMKRADRRLPPLQCRNAQHIPCASTAGAALVPQLLFYLQRKRTCTSGTWSTCAGPVCEPYINKDNTYIRTGLAPRRPLLTPRPLIRPFGRGDHTTNLRTR